MSTRKERGLCSSCGRARRPHRTLCQHCASRRRELVLTKKNQGLCIKISCKNRALAGETRCLQCKMKRNAYNRQLARQRRRHAGTAGTPEWHS